MPGHPEFRPVSGRHMPRYAGPVTFMRLPTVDPATVEGLQIGLAGVPWDGGTSNRAGARHGPREMRSASALMRQVHHATLAAPYELAACADVGDAPVNPLDLMGTLDMVEAFFATLHGRGIVPLTAGGDHLITLPILRAIARERPVGLVHFDAHSDTGEDHFGVRYGHGTVFKRATEEGLLEPGRVIQIGLRGGFYEPGGFDWALAQGMRLITIEEYKHLGVDAVIAEIARVAGDGPTYATFDVDGLDPVYAPGTGTPEVGGFDTHEAQCMIRSLRALDLVGADVVEVAPPLDPSGLTTLTGVTMMWELLCVVAQAVARRTAAG